MRLTFLGTRGGILGRSRTHAHHSALLVERRGRRIVIDCGADWRGRIEALTPDAILLTHAHPDHAGGLVDGAPCPVHATADTWRALARTPGLERRTVVPGVAFEVLGLAVRAFPVVHSVLAPAIGYRVGEGGVAFAYVPDVADLPEHGAELVGLTLYVGDGARLVRPLIRRTSAGEPFGHTSMRTQLTWCASAGVRRAIFTHCGSEIVRADGRTLAARVRAMGRALGVEARIAADGLQVSLPPRRGADAHPLRRDRSRAALVRDR